MRVTTTRTPPIAIRVAAGDLAYLLRLARIYLASTRPRVCYDCGHLFTIASLDSGRRCMCCGIARTEAPNEHR